MVLAEISCGAERFIINEKGIFSNGSKVSLALGEFEKMIAHSKKTWSVKGEWIASMIRRDIEKLIKERG